MSLADIIPLDEGWDRNIKPLALDQLEVSTTFRDLIIL